MRRQKRETHLRGGLWRVAIKRYSQLVFSREGRVGALNERDPMGGKGKGGRFWPKKGEFHSAQLIEGTSLRDRAMHTHIPRMESNPNPARVAHAVEEAAHRSRRIFASSTKAIDVEDREST